MLTSNAGRGPRMSSIVAADAAPDAASATAACREPSRSVRLRSMDQRSVSMRRTRWIGASCLAGVWLSAFVYVQAQAPASQPAPPSAPPSQAAPPGQPRPPGGGGGGAGQAGPPGPRRAPGESPASEKRPVTVTKQTYPAAQVEAGQARFASMCGFCHGRDAAGGETGPDLTWSALVASDVRGNKLGPMIRAGRPDKGMPPFTISDADLIAIVAFIHDTKVKAETLGGGRRSVDVTDLQTGNAAAGKAYFAGAGGCATCHQLTGEFATVGARYQGLPLLQRMLYPGSGGRTNNPPPAPAVMTIKTERRQDGDGKTGLSRRIHHHGDGRGRLVAFVAGGGGDHQRRRSAEGARRSTRQVHGSGHARRLRVPAVAALGALGKEHHETRIRVGARDAVRRRGGGRATRRAGDAAQSALRQLADVSRRLFRQASHHALRDHAGERASVDARLVVPDQLAARREGDADPVERRDLSVRARRAVGHRRPHRASALALHVSEERRLPHRPSRRRGLSRISST